MNSVTRFRLVKLGLLVVLAASLSSGLLMAHNAIEGDFTLPVEVHWGRATLPGQQYHFALGSNTAPYTITVRGTAADGKVAMILSTGAVESAAIGRSELVLVRHGSMGTVRVLRLAPLGVALRYKAPKREHNPLIAQAPELIQRIPISERGK